jgi:hypothetical protein
MLFILNSNFICLSLESITYLQTDMARFYPETPTNLQLIIPYITKCVPFVSKLCGDREDGAHDDEHIAFVGLDAKTILEADYANEEALMWICTIIVAIIHEVLDYKFPDVDNKRRDALVQFLRSLELKGLKGIDITEELINIASHVSFKKEYDAIKAGAPIDYEKLNTDNLPFASKVFYTVSDADRLDALRKRGFTQRLLPYTRFVFKREHGRDPAIHELRAIVDHHCEVKLLRLKDHYMKTKTGKLMAVSAHDEFVAAYKDLFF